jgi:hypothetical protein
MADERTSLNSVTEETHQAGVAAEMRGDFPFADDLFAEALTNAKAAGHDVHAGRIHRDWAQRYWRDGQLSVARVHLDSSYGLIEPYANNRNVLDELGITVSVLGRLAAVTALHLMEDREQPEAWRSTSLPHFREAQSLLKGGNSYYRYSNGGHGAIVSAFANAYGRWSSHAAEASGAVASQPHVILKNPRVAAGLTASGLALPPVPFVRKKLKSKLIR